MTQDAKDAEEAASADRSIKFATEAIGMIGRTDIVPKNLRDEGRLKRIRDTLALIRRDMGSDVELANVLNTMQRELTAGNVAAAYAAHKQLIDEYPDLKSNEKLSEMVRRVAEAEVQTVRAVEQQQSARNEEPTSPVIASVAMGQPSGRIVPGGRSTCGTVSNSRRRLRLRRRHGQATLAPARRRGLHTAPGADRRSGR